MNQSLIVKDVNFENISMVACQPKGNKIYVGIRSICDGLGIDYSSQYKRIERDDLLPEGVVKMTIPTDGGEQEIKMLDIEYLPFFLVGIKSAMCNERIRPRLKEFKIKAKDVLASAFIKNIPTAIEYKKLLQREAGKIVRNMLTDTIRDRIPESPHKQFIYPNYTKLIYKILFNKTINELRCERKVPKNKNLRDYFNADELKEIQQIENIITGLIALGMSYKEIKDILIERYIKLIA